MPFSQIDDCWHDIEEVDRVITDYYLENWSYVRHAIEQRLDKYAIDKDAKAALTESLDGFEAGNYRSVCRVLFPEIERVARKELFNDKLDISPRAPVEHLVGRDCSMHLEDFLVDGPRDLCLFGYMTEHLRAERDPASDMPSSQGLNTHVNTVASYDAAQSNPIPNRHASLHGLVPYQSNKNALNTIFITDYMFAVFSRVIRKRIESTSRGHAPHREAEEGARL